MFTFWVLFIIMTGALWGLNEPVDTQKEVVIKLGTQAVYAQVHKQVYRVVVYNIRGQKLGEFEIGKVVWDNPKRIEKMIAKRYKLRPGLYILSITGATGSKYHKFYVGG